MRTLSTAAVILVGISLALKVLDVNLTAEGVRIGVCTDPRIHPFEEINELDRMIAWLKRHEAALAGSQSEWTEIPGRTPAVAPVAS